MAKTLKKAYVADEIEISPYTIGLLDQSVLIGRPIPEKRKLNKPEFEDVSENNRQWIKGIFWRGVIRMKR